MNFYSEEVYPLNHFDSISLICETIYIFINKRAFYMVSSNYLIKFLIKKVILVYESSNIYAISI